jgi:hypothetical protein
MSMLRYTQVRKAGFSHMERNIMFLQKNVQIDKCKFWENLQNKTYEVRNPSDYFQKNKNR